MMTFFRFCFNPRNTSYKFEVCVRDGETLVFVNKEALHPILVREGESISVEVGLGEPWPRDVMATAEVVRVEKEGV
jgi:hypothetical protein